MTTTNPPQPRTLTGSELRSRFVDYFSERLGTELPSASLVPQNDPTVLLTVAGMQQNDPLLRGG
jgi:alanyl-tRNA synthetase